MLQRIEGHFVRGYGDRSRDVSLQIYPEAAKEAEEFLQCETQTRVAKLIEAYETPYGMELLASVHWVAVHENEQVKTDPDTAVSGVLSWNEHKSRTFTPKRILAAWDRLRSESWF